jgi:hypothetical protein
MIELLRRVARRSGAGHRLSLFADILSQEEARCRPSGAPAKAAALARGAIILTHAAKTVAD